MTGFDRSLMDIVSTRARGKTSSRVGLSSEGHETSPWGLVPYVRLAPHGSLPPKQHPRCSTEQNSVPSLANKTLAPHALRMRCRCF